MQPILVKRNAHSYGDISGKTYMGLCEEEKGNLQGAEGDLLFFNTIPFVITKKNRYLQTLMILCDHG